jgi:RNA polymerase sigma-70 factor (ECF subfamily)
MKAFRYYGKFKKGTNFRAWLFKILRNSFINHYRKSVAESFRTQNLEMDLDAVPSAPLLPDASLPTDELGLEVDGKIREALASLPEGYRRMVVLKDLNHYSYDEIAHLAHIPLGTVMSRLFRGRRMLEKALISYGRQQRYLQNPLAFRLRSRSISAF